MVVLEHKQFYSLLQLITRQFFFNPKDSFLLNLRFYFEIHTGLQAVMSEAGTI